MFRLIALVLTASILIGCGSDSTSDEQGQQGLALELYVDLDDWGDSNFIHGYISKEGVEIFYGQSLFVYRTNEGEWTVNEDEDIYVFGAEIISPQHWVITIVRDIFGPNAAYYVEETEDAGVTWSSALFDSENPESEYVSALAYDFDNDLIYAAFNLGLAVSEVPVGPFNQLESSGNDQGVATKLLLNPNRNELWWIGYLALAIADPPGEDAHVRRFHLSDEGVSSEDLTQEIGLSRAFGGLFYINDPNVVFIAGRKGISRTEDSGSSWERIFDGSEVANIVYSETTGNLYWATLSSTVVEVFCSRDLGYTWSSELTEELPEYGRISLIEINGDALLIGFDRYRTYKVDIEDISCD